MKIFNKSLVTIGAFFALVALIALTRAVPGGAIGDVLAIGEFLAYCFLIWKYVWSSR